MRSDFSLNIIIIYTSPSRTQQHFPPCVGVSAQKVLMRSDFSLEKKNAACEKQ